MEFNEIVEKTFKFYGVHDTSFKLGRYVFQAVEDEDDGYRSYLDCVRVIEDENLVFLRRSFANVKIESHNVGEFEGFRLVDANTGHVWLKFGTNHTDDYYPYFVFEYTTPVQVEMGDLHSAIRVEWPLDSQYHREQMQNLDKDVIDFMNSGDYDAAIHTLQEFKETITYRKDVIAYRKAVINFINNGEYDAAEQALVDLKKLTKIS